MSRDVLGKSQMAVLQIVFRERGDAYGASIFSAMDADGKSMPLAQIYSILDKLSTKGFVTSQMSAPVAERGGRRKKLYEITGDGQRALSHAMANSAALETNGSWIPV